MHRMLPASLRGEFQDFPAWRQGVYEVLDRCLSRYDGTVIAPMTIIEPDYVRETVGRLRERGHNVRHFALLAERETVLRRLRERGFGRALQLVGGQAVSLWGESFAVSRLDDCLLRLRDPQFSEQIWTDHLTVAQVADRIAASAGVTLAPNRDSPIHGRLRRAWTGVRHIRLD